jgi:addiction module HigA family antidote
MGISREDAEAGRVDLSEVIESGAPDMPPEPPGAILYDWMEDFGLSANALARALRVPPNRITGILRGERAITAETALRLGRYFGTSARFWLNLQSSFDLERAKDLHGERVAREVMHHAA